jgi:hypothetical protein
MSRIAISYQILSARLAAFLIFGVLLLELLSQLLSPAALEHDVDDSDDEENQGGNPGQQVRAVVEEPEDKRGQTAYTLLYKTLKTPLPPRVFRKLSRFRIAFTFISAPMMQIPKKLRVVRTTRRRRGRG